MGDAINLAIALAVVSVVDGFAAWAVWRSLKAAKKLEEEEKKHGQTEQ